MNRRNFFKNLGAATVGVIVAPAVVMGIIKTEPEPQYTTYHFKGYTFYFKRPPDATNLLRWKLGTAKKSSYSNGSFTISDFDEITT